MRVLVPGISDCLPFYVEGTPEDFAKLILKEQVVRTKEELGRMAFAVRQPNGDYGKLDESGKRHWDEIGQTLYNVGLNDAAALALKETGESANTIARDIWSIKVK